MIKKIITIPNTILREKSKRIGYIDDSIRELARDMIETTLDWDHDTELGAALAAIQVGHPIRLTVIREELDKEGSKDFITLINPKIVKSSAQFVTDIEGCLSVPGMYGRVKRSLKIKVNAQDENGNELRLNLEGFAARVVAHEIDHMQGILFLDHIDDTKDILQIDEHGNLSPLQPDAKIDLP